MGLPIAGLSNVREALSSMPSAQTQTLDPQAISSTSLEQTGADVRAQPAPEYAQAPRSSASTPDGISPPLPPSASPVAAPTPVHEASVPEEAHTFTAAIEPQPSVPEVPASQLKLAAALAEIETLRLQRDDAMQQVCGSVHRAPHEMKVNLIL